MTDVNLAALAAGDNYLKGGQPYLLTQATPVPVGVPDTSFTPLLVRMDGGTLNAYIVPAGGGAPVLQGPFTFGVNEATADTDIVVTTVDGANGTAAIGTANADATVVSHAWAVVPSTATFNDATLAAPILTTPTNGTYQVCDTVTYSDGNSKQICGSVDVTGGATAADLDTDIAGSGVDQGDGTANLGITDGDPTVTGHSWSIVSGGTGTFSSTAVQDPVFTADGNGTYTLRDMVSYSDGSTKPVDTVVTVSGVLSESDLDTNIAANTTDNGDGTATLGVSNADPSVVSYAWTSVPAGTFGNPTAVDGGGFTGSGDGAYTLTNTVTYSDGSTKVLTAPLTITGTPTESDLDIDVAASGVNQADGTANLSIAFGDGTITSHAWSIVSGGTGTFSDPTLPNAVFTADDDGTYTLRDTITYSDGSTKLVDTSVTISGTPTDADNDTGITDSGTPDGSGGAALSVVSGNPSATHSWTIVSGGTGSFSSTTAPNPTFTADTNGTYVLRDTVTYPDGSTKLVDVTVTITGVVSEADSDTDITASAVTDFSLNATLSLNNVDATATGYAWTAVPGTGEFDSAASATPQYTATATGSYTFTCTVSYSDGSSKDVPVTADLIQAFELTTGDAFEFTAGDPVEF